MNSSINKKLFFVLFSLLLYTSFISAQVTTDSRGFYISQWNGFAFEEIYNQQYQVEYSTNEFAFNVIDGKVLLRIVQNGIPFADIDMAKLVASGKELIPLYARFTGNNQSILNDIIEIDHDVVLAHEKEIEICWEMPDECREAILFLNANEYGHGSPYPFPNSGTVGYEMGSKPGSIVVDGRINETDGTTPLYVPFWTPSTGHPDGYTYIYICDDSKYVFFSIDVTGDNTDEYGEDWAEITIISQDGSERVFRIDDFDNTWGRAVFGLTSKVSYKHQTLEFGIPKDIIGYEDFEFKLLYYGTLAVNTPPEVIVNNGADVDEGENVTITRNMLQSTNSRESDYFIYTLTNLPGNGILKKNNVSLGNYGTFSQDDINANSITYLHNGSETTLDSFTFEVADNTNQTSPVETFEIRVSPVNDTVVIENLPGSLIFVVEDSIIINIWQFIGDSETPTPELIYGFTVVNDSLKMRFDYTTGDLTLSAVEGFSGNVELTIKVTDPEGAFKEVVITVTVESSTTDIDDFANGTPKEVTLHQNYPNPFNPSTIIRFGLPEASNVNIVVYNMLGQKVVTLVNQIMSSGYHEITFDASGINSGIYLYKIEAGSYTEIKKMILMK